ncbi:unnamed protein product [Dibothriocephalus latus]|uniref:E3 ubiquitin-protein ligase n=1 Tax=Dibothriocephalus latus TaxID=60516 RepID=A0A3P7KWZ3_DIBLA|nr:unnamed protein product [Dibothriocephalus latus]
MNSMQRNLEGKSEVLRKLIPVATQLEPLNALSSLSAQIASTDRILLLSAIKETRKAFEQRVGLIDRCFRVKPFIHKHGNSLVRIETKEPASLSFQALGATSEVYEYDVAIMRGSIVQPLPRLLATLYGHGIEMGLHPTLLGLADEGFANLVIERPLRVVAFLAQCSANLWLQTNGLIEKIVTLWSSFFRLWEQMMGISTAETVGCDYQLLQQAAAVLHPDELIVRMVHKLNLKDYLSEKSSQPSSGSVQAAESLLRVLHFIVTSRSIHGVGYFDPSIVAAIPSLPQLFPPDFNDLDESLEIEDAVLVDDIIHQLCLRPMTPSEVCSALPSHTFRSCLYELPPYCGLRGSAGHNSSTSIGDRKLAVRRLNDKIGPISNILQKVATQMLVGEDVKVTLRPDVLVVRFDLFHPSYGSKQQSEAKDAVIQSLTQAHEVNANLFPVDFPIPPPPPRPRRRFLSHLNAPILRLLRCPTFVRLLRQLLDIGIKYGSQQSRWSETLLELVLHLIIIALYEDFVAFTETGERPFLKAVSLVPEASESAEELEHLAELRHWERQDPPASTN